MDARVGVAQLVGGSRARWITAATLLAAWIAALPTRDVHAQTPAQDFATHEEFSPLDIPAKLSIDRLPLADALNRLQTQSGVSLVYSPSRIPDRVVSCPCHALTVGQSLDHLLRDSGLGYSTDNEHVIIAPAARSPSPRTASLTGRVVDQSTLRPVEGAQVYIESLSRGTLTNEEGAFTLLDVPVGEHELAVGLIGYATERRAIDASSARVVNVEFALTHRALPLDEVVVTGVAAQTPRTLLPFTVDRLDVRPILGLMATNAAGLLKGRIAGATVRQGSGQPGEETGILLRGATSISGKQSPLIIVDGIMTSGSLADINPRDIENIEVIKGAAAASLYGSRAQAGVISITTRRGAALTLSETRFTLRNQFAVNDIDRLMGASSRHFYRMTEDGSAFVDVDGNPTTNLNERVLAGEGPMSTFAINEYPPSMGGYRNVLDQFFSPGRQYSTYTAAEGRHGDLNYRLSAGIARDEGVVRFHEGATQRNLRLNVDHRIGTALSLSLGAAYTRSDQDLIAQGELGILRDLSLLEPMYDLLEPDPATNEIRPIVGPQGGAINNTLYAIKSTQDTRSRDRAMGGLSVRFAPSYWLTLEGNLSYDRSTLDERHLIPRGFPQIDSESGDMLPPHPGSMSRFLTTVDEMNASFTASISRTFGEFVSRSSLRALYERREEDQWSAEGSGFSVVGVPRFGLLQSWDEVDSYFSRTRAAGFFAISSVIFRDRYVADVLARRDGSSLFGANERWQNFYRVSGAWRMSEEGWWPFESITEFKPRLSIGTAGGRPAFEAQYQTYAVDRNQISPKILGNPDLKPELATEREAGLDAVFSQRVFVGFSYASTRVKDQILLSPMAGYYGYTAQWRNAGTIESRTWEASLEAALVERPGFVWTSYLNVDRTTQRVTDLQIPSFQIRFLRGTMYVVEGEPLGVFYGKKWAASCDDLPAGAECSDFAPNDEGLLVYVGAGNSWRDGRAKNLWGTAGESGEQIYQWGIPVAASPWPEPTRLGKGTPDFTVSWGNSIRYGDVTLDFLLDGEYGSKVYNTTRQWQGSRNRGFDIDQSGKPEEAWKPIGYYTTLYDVNIPNSYWLRDASYLKLRELSLGYAFSRNQLAPLLGNMAPERASVVLFGRNLKTWTGYEGFDPEVGSERFLGSAAIGRIDEYSYPNYRSFGVDVELVF